MALTTTEFADAMKTFYIPPLNDQVHRATVLLNRLEKNSEDVSGNHAHVPVITARNPGVGSRRDVATTGPKLPAAGRQTYDTATYKMALHYGRGSVSGPLMRASKSSASAFAKAIDVEMQGLTKRLPEDLNRQLWSYGSGRCASVVTTYTSGDTTIEISSTDVFAGRVGDRVTASDITDGPVQSNNAAITITAIAFDQDATGAASSTVHTLTVADIGANFTTAEDALYYGDSISDEEDVSRQQEMYGVPAAVDDGNIGADESDPIEADELLDGSLSFGSIDRTTVSSWKAQVLQNPSSAGTNRQLTTALLEQAFLHSVAVGGASEKSMEVYTNPGLWATIGLLHIGDRRFNDYKETLKGGWLALMFNGIPIFYDRDAPRDKIYFLDMSSLMLLTQSGYELMDEDGAVLSRISGRDAYEFTLYRDIQFASRNNSVNTLLDDISASMNINVEV